MLLGEDLEGANKGTEHMTASIKIRQLESKISDLQTQHQFLLKKRLQEIAVLLSTIDLAHLDDKTLLGGLLFIRDKITTQNPMVEAWHAAGEKFLRRSKPKNRSHTDGEQARNRPQIPSEKYAPPKEIATPQTRDQSAQK